MFTYFQLSSGNTRSRRPPDKPTAETKYDFRSGSLRSNVTLPDVIGFANFSHSGVTDSRRCNWKPFPSHVKDLDPDKLNHMVKLAHDDTFTKKYVRPNNSLLHHSRTSLNTFYVLGMVKRLLKVRPYDSLSDTIPSRPSMRLGVLLISVGE